MCVCVCVFRGGIQISVIMRAGTEPRCLPKRKQFTSAVCICE